jgi:hypothetical protein
MLASLLTKKILVETVEHEVLGTGITQLPLLRVNRGLLPYDQANLLDVLGPDDIDTSKPTISCSRGGGMPGPRLELPLEVVKAEKLCDRDLLSYYFAGVREHMAIAQFRSFYNVLEFFFDEAPKALGRSARIERDQITCVVRWAISEKQFQDCLRQLRPDYQKRITADLITSAGEPIPGLSLSQADVLGAFASWLYRIRCACIHSKLTRHAKPTVRFVPYTTDEDLVAAAVPLIQKVAIECIRKSAWAP